jgi:hypothetical protein
MHAPASPFETPPFGRLLILKASVASVSKDEEVSPLSYAIAPLRDRDGVCGGGGYKSRTPFAALPYFCHGAC